jgi:hypothetical protein
MPTAIIKPKRDEDFYVRYSTIVDSPCESGTREAMVAFGIDPERCDRADEAGTSALWGYTDDTLWLGWQETTIHVREGVSDPTEPEDAWWGTIARADIRAFCETLGDDGNFHPPAGMVTWELPESTDS